MKLYTSKRAPNPRRVEMYLAEKGIEVPLEQVNIMKGEHKTPEYRKVSPLPQIPALILDDGRCITESVAICRYFEAQNPNPPLFGTDAISQAEVEMWTRRMELMVMIPSAMAFRHQHPAMAALETQIPEWGKLNYARAEKTIKFMDKQLEGKEFLTGEFSNADIVGYTSLDFGMALAGLKIPEDCKNVAAWYKRMSERPSAKACM